MLVLSCKVQGTASVDAVKNIGFNLKKKVQLHFSGAPMYKSL